MGTLKVGFLIIDKHTGIGGLENVLVDITRGLESLSVVTELFFLQKPEHTSLLQEFKHQHILKDISQPKITHYLPKIIRHNIWKVKFKQESKKFLSRKLNEANLDALVVLNISKNFIRISPTLLQYKTQNPTVPIIAWPHISLTSSNISFLKKHIQELSIFDDMFAISSGLQNEFNKELHFKQTHLIYNPIKPVKNVIDRDPSKFLFLGRVNDPRKRVKELLQQLTQLKGEWHLDLIGGTGIEAEDKKFIQYINNLQLSDHVTFHGWQKDPWSIVNKAGVLLLNSTYEGFGLVLAEAMMRGIPCISSNCPVGPNEIIIEGVNGWLYDVNDPNQPLNYLQGIINKEITLPPQTDIIASVQKFSEATVLKNFKNALLAAIHRLKNNVK